MKGIEDMIFFGEIVLQSKIAQRAAQRLEANHTSSDHVEIWCSIQSILVASGNVSKILWPIRKEYKARGERLRQLLKIEIDNPLSIRSFRNYFEHYDEEVDRWFKNYNGGPYKDLSMNPSLKLGIFDEGFDRGDHRGYKRI